VSVAFEAEGSLAQQCNLKRISIAACNRLQMSRMARVAALLIMICAGCIRVRATVKVSVEMGAAGDEGCDVVLKIDLNFAAALGQEHRALAVVALLDDAVMSNETIHPTNDSKRFLLPELPYSFHEFKALVLRGGAEVAKSVLAVTLHREAVLPAMPGNCFGDESSGFACDLQQQTSTDFFLPQGHDDFKPRLWIVMNAWPHHAILVSNRKRLKFHHPDGSAPVISKIAARGTRARHVCSASVLIRFAYVHERNANDSIATSFSTCSEYFLATHLVPPLQRNAVNVSSIELRRIVCFSSQIADHGSITSLDLVANVSANILVETYCPPNCGDSAVEVHLQTRMYVAPFPHCIIVTLWPGTSTTRQSTLQAPPPIPSACCVTAATSTTTVTRRMLPLRASAQQVLALNGRVRW
jgi:hypothetical protein